MDTKGLGKTATLSSQDPARVSFPESSQEDLPKLQGQIPTATAFARPHSPFPALMNAYAQWGQFKTFNICGATEEDRIFLVEIHTGYSAGKPLGTRPGVLLHNGMTKRDSILAAAGEANTLGTSSSATVDGQVVALLMWCKLFPSFKHAFTLQLLGRGQTGEFGERWSLMVVMTALRLQSPCVKGKTTKKLIAAGEKMSAK